MKNETLITLGKICRESVKALELSGQRVSPTAVTEAQTRPKTHLLGLLVARAMRVRSEELQLRLGALMEELDPEDVLAMPDFLPLDAQGVLQLGYFQHKTAPLPDLRKGPARIDWAQADWSRTDQELAEENGVSTDAVRKARKKASE